MPDNKIQIQFEIDIKALQTGLQQGASAVEQHTNEMAKQFKELAKQSKEAIDDLEKAAKLADVDISEEMKSVLEEIPKLANGIAAVFSGGGVLAFLGVLLDVGIALKGLFDEVVLLKGAKQEWAEIDNKLAEVNEALDAKMRQSTVERIRQTQGAAAAARASLAMADQEVVGFGKNVDQILAGKKVDKLSEGLRKDLENLNHFTFAELQQKITDVQEAIKRGSQGIQDKKDQILAAEKEGDYEAAATLTSAFQSSIEQGEGELKVLGQVLETLLKVQEAHGKDKDVQKGRIHELDVAAYEKAQQKLMESFRKGLQDRKDALDAFHTLSAQDEVKYWDSIIASHKAKSQNLIEVQHLRLEAHKEADRQALRDEVEKIQEQVEAAKTGSQERVRIFNDELAKMRANHQEQTEEYKRLEKERNRAVEEAAKKELRDEIEKVHEQVKTTKAGSQERIDILEAELARLRADNRQETDEYKRLWDEKLRAVDEHTKALKDAEDEHSRGVRQHADAERALAQSQLDFQLKIGNISEAQYEALMRQELEATYKKDHDELESELSKLQKGSKEYERVQNEITKLDDKHLLDREKLEQQSYLRRTKNIDAFFSHVKSAMDQSISGFLKGTESFSKAWKDMWSDMVVSMVQKLADMLLKWIQHHVTMLIVHATTKQSQVATEAAAETEKNAIQASGHMKEITRTAQRAAGHAYDAVVGIPIVGPVMAPIAAGVAFAAVEGFGLMSAEGGQYIVPGDQLTMLHRNEMVLPAGVADRMRGVIDGGGGGGISVFVNHSVHAVDAESFRAHIRRHGNMIGNEVARVLKRKGFAPSR